MVDFIIIRTHLHGVKLGVLCDQPGQVLDAVQGGGGAAGLQDKPPPRDEHRALGQHVGVHLGEGVNILPNTPSILFLIAFPPNGDNFSSDQINLRFGDEY